ncbi:MAG: magnesium transporter [Acholeplasmataceae bacterium]|nr:magnesium transporter [Acholeplasmataceae bacterium]
MKHINFKHSDDSLKKTLKTMHAFDISIYFPQFDELEKQRIIALLDQQKLSDMFILLSEEEQWEVIELLSESRKKALFRSLESDDLKEFMASLNEEKQAIVFSLLSAVKAKTIRLLLEYEDDSAASIMSTDFISIHQDMSIKEATNKLVTTSKDQDYIDSIYVLDDDKMLVGVIDLKDLIIARSNQKLVNIMIADYHFVYEDDSIELAIQTVKDYDRNAIPVLDEEHHMLGIVTADDVFDELVEDIEFDYQRMALLDNHESTSSALTRSKQRLPWLLIGVVLNLIMASFLSIFEVTIAEVVALVLFQPLILGMAGNIGTQSLAVTILGFHREEFDRKKMPKTHVIKEITIGLLNSLLLGIAAYFLVFGFLSLIPTGSQSADSMAFVVGLATSLSMFVSASMGALIPIFLNRIQIDPSTASGPIMTTINDLVSLVIYFGIATIMFL